MRMATALSVTVLAAGGVGHALVTGLDTGITRVDPFKDMKNRPQAGHGMNVLVVGTDGRDRITPEEKAKYRLGGAPCHCTDTVMLVHISEDRDRASVVSLPRDSYAEMPEHTDLNSGRKHHAHPVKLNAAYAEGGPSLTVRTVESMTGVKIDHYLEVDFTSFMRTVDAVGGVQICTTRPVKDAYTGLDLAAGTHELDGGQALQYVRSRHIDGAADIGRMQRQQRFLAALIDRMTSGGVLFNPVRFREVATTMLSSVRADQDFGTDQLLALAKAMRGFTPASSEFVSVPVGDMSFPVKGIGSTVKWDAAKAQKLFQALREDRPLAPAAPAASSAKAPKDVVVDVPPRTVRVQVYNGTRTDGLGRKVDDALRGTGFDTTRTPMTSAGQERARTVVEYDPRWDRSAKTLAAALPGAELKPVAGRGGTLRVTVGSDYKGVRGVRAEDAGRGGPFEAVTGDRVVCP
ncbi:LytR family transcriptional regulator [Streptomyces venezuelae]|nr:LCP family protein [Streptomyces venezuelae]APE21966.1 LytR family transcriptional regulator [Streptomyces venezuelae]QER99359.1 LytR family transcriptional regulator [Streptomyces venezuelae ATCC 10712]QES06434.1 LytR family transcriptional regulator [Streptomyces venezuelae]QES14830.1 LytR family transcriptional regulator [Streptomyces venezuelae]